MTSPSHLMIPGGSDCPRILIIDDNPSIHRDFDLVFTDEARNPGLEADEKRVFGREDQPEAAGHTYQVDHAMSGLEGVEKVREALRAGSSYQVAFVDIRMPGIDGVETIKRIWKHDPDIQMVICTAYADYSQEDLTGQLGMTDKLLVLKKPFDSIEVTQLACTLAEKWFVTRQAALKMEEMELLVARRTEKVLDLQRRESQRLHELDESRLRFLTTLCRELRTPLSLLLGPLDQMMAGEKTGRKQQELMHRNAGRLLRLVNQLQDFGRLETGDLELHPAETDLVTCLRGVVQLFIPIATEQKVELQFETDQESRRAWFDAEKLERVLFNLLSHALTFTPENGRVTVRARFTPSAIEIIVEDDGVGIAEADLPFAFDPFHPAASRGMEEAGRTGVGLALSLKLVQLLGGSITVASPSTVGPDHPRGRGTRFTIQLNLDEKSRAAGSALASRATAEVDATGEDPEGADSKLPVILIVGDDADICAYVGQRLGPDYRLVEASDGLSALARAQELVPDLIIADLSAGDLDGIELCRRLQTVPLTSHVPVIILASQDSEEQQLRALGAGADDYIVKPFSLSLLKARVENLLESRRRLRAHISPQAMFQPRDVALNQADAQFLQRLVTIIGQHLSDFEFDIDALSRLAGVSRRQLFRKLKAVIDLTPKALIRDMRLKRAARLLETSEMTVSEVTYAVGFSDVKHFRNLFREQFGVLPGEFVKRLNQDPAP